MQLQTFRAGCEGYTMQELELLVQCGLPEFCMWSPLLPPTGVHVHMIFSVLTCLLQTLCTAFTLPLALALAMLLVWNLWLAARNLTTIEFHEVSH